MAGCAPPCQPGLISSLNRTARGKRHISFVSEFEDLKRVDPTGLPSTTRRLERERSEGVIVTAIKRNLLSIRYRLPRLISPWG
jgi:hypothetical protein